MVWRAFRPFARSTLSMAAVPSAKRSSFGSTPLRRLLLLLAALLVALGALIAQRAWFSPEAREARYARMSASELEKQASRSSDPMLHYYLARRRIEVGDVAGGTSAIQE